MTKSKTGGLSRLPKEQVCSFLIGPDSSWFMPNSLDLWTQPRSKQEIESQPTECDTTSYFVYGAIGCFCLGEVQHRLGSTSVDKQKTPLNQVAGIVNKLIDVKSDNSRVACVRFEKTLPVPVILALSENGSLVIYDHILDRDLLHFKKADIFKRFNIGPVSDNSGDDGSEQLSKRPKLDISRQINSCTWPNPNNIFLGLTLLKEKKCLLLRLKLNNIAEWRNKESVTNDLISSSHVIEIAHDNDANPINLIESTMLNEKVCLLAIAMDDRFMTVISLNLEENRTLRTVRLGRDSQVCSMSLYVGQNSQQQREYPLGLLASVSRDGHVMIWDIKNEFCFADYQVNATKINWFALKFISIPNLKHVYLAVSNAESILSLLEVPDKVKLTKIRLKDIIAAPERKHHKKSGNQDRPSHCEHQVAPRHNKLIFNIEYDPATQTLITSSKDGSLILWKANETSGCPVPLEVQQQFHVPTMTKEARCHMLRHSHIREDLLCMALGEAGVRFYSIREKLLDSKFQLSADNSSYCLASRLISKDKQRPTSVAWHPNHEYRIAVGTLEGTVYRADIMPRKLCLVESGVKRDTKSKEPKTESTPDKDILDDILGVDYKPMESLGQAQGTQNGKQKQRPKTDGIYSICWGPNPASSDDKSKFAIYAIGSISHALFIYYNSKDDTSREMSDYLAEFHDTSLPEAAGLASEVAWKSSMDLMALGTMDGRILIVTYLEESHQDRSNHKLFKRIMTIQGPLGSVFVQCLSWHPTTDKDDQNYYKLAASSNESPAYVFNLKESMLAAEVKEQLGLNGKLNGNDGANVKIESEPNTAVLSCYANKLKAHQKAITDIAWNPHEPNQLATCSFDRTCLVWSLDGSFMDARVIAKFTARERLFTLDWSLVDENLIYTSGHDSVVWAWRPSENRHSLNIPQTVDMNDPKVFNAPGASGTGFKNAFADPLVLATKPAVIFKFASSALALVVYSCISSAWYDGRCLFNKYNGICRFGSLTLISFLVCVALLILELLFGHISSLKVRKRIAIGDVIISGVNTIYYLLLFVFLAIAWLKSDYPPYGHSINCCRVAILLSFLAIFALAACTGLAYVRWQSGADMSAQFLNEDQIAQEQAQYYDQAGNYQAGVDQGGYTMDPGPAGGQYASGQYMNYGDVDINSMGQQQQQ